MKLLLAEDEIDLSDALCALLKHNNYTVDAVFDGGAALDYIEGDDYDAVILDIMMPVKDGFCVLREMREKGYTTPVLMLTAKSQVEDKIKGLDLGADDYLAKPFHAKELLARIRALLRRQGEFTPETLRFGNIELDRMSYILKSGEKSLRLGNKEFQMMEMLIKNPSHLISTEKFMTRIWGYDSDTEINVVWVYISYLRKKLASLNANIQIRATRGVGYALEMKHD